MNKAVNASEINRMRSTPISVPRTMRMHNLGGIKSLPAGRMVPLAAAGLLREDQVRSGPMTFSFAHHETAELLLNAVNVRVLCYFVPMLALERFNGSMDQLNLSYEGKPPIAGQPVVPFIETAAFGAHGSNSIYKYLGLHSGPTDMVNTAYRDSYNAIWNYRAKNRSPKLALRLKTATDLAPAFWVHDQFSHIVPNFDAASMDGHVPLQIVDPKMPVRGLRFTGDTYGGATYNMHADPLAYEAGATKYNVVMAQNPGGVGVGHVWAELKAAGLSMSLASIELATKTKAFAELRKQYNGNEEHVTNLLMDGIYVAEQDLKNPILIGQSRTVFGQSKRYASDAGNLTVSAVDGMTQIQMNIRVPRMNTGGVLMLVAEITPDQLFERQEDPFFHAQSVADLPQYLRDELDPEKVDAVLNGQIDRSHSNPLATFGYCPKNAKWNVSAMRVGGDLYRPTTTTATDSDRQRIWAVDIANPSLATDFYLCTNIHLKPFMNRTRDPFEVVTEGDILIEGNTVFGGHLLEAHPSNDYQKVLAEADQTKIQQVV